MKHIHQYERRLWGDKGTAIYRCILPNCTHYLFPEFIDGKTSLCPFCNNPFTITKSHVSRKTKTPHCGCKTKKEPKVSEVNVNELLKKIGAI